MPVPKGYKHKKGGSKRACAAGSFRRVRSGKALITVCCPKGKWSSKSKRCKVGTHAIGIDQLKSFGMLPPVRGQRCPVKEGTRVVFTPNPVSLRLYSPPTPKQGELGTVTAVSFGARHRACLPGPGGGLVYVKWDQLGTMGVSPIDLGKIKR